jgi:hypothetical protein
MDRQPITAGGWRGPEQVNHHGAGKRLTTGEHGEQRKRWQHHQIGIADAAGRRGDNEGECAVGPNAAVAHDFKTTLAAFATTQTIGGIGQTVFMQGTCQQQPEGCGQHASQQGRNLCQVSEQQQQGRECANQGTSEREHAHGLVQRRHVQCAGEGNWQSREEAKRMHQFRHWPDGGW